MALIDWDNGMSVNVAEIDTQHKRLVELINELNEAMRNRTAKDVLKEIIDKLADYAAVHFSTEEGYFDQFGYPKAGPHRREHKAFVKKVADFQKGFEEGQLMLSIDVINFLKDWLLNHIQGVDKQYSAFFNENGLT